VLFAVKPSWAKYFTHLPVTQRRYDDISAIQGIAKACTRCARENESCPLFLSIVFICSDTAGNVATGEEEQ
jgi:hypothetical protein